MVFKRSILWLGLSVSMSLGSVFVQASDRFSDHSLDHSSDRIDNQLDNHHGSHLENHAMQSLTDHELSDVTGQSLMSLSFIAPTDQENKMAGQNIGFYKLGVEADVELNANIKKLQLGCGGINGANGCDIDIDNLSLSGQADSNTGRASSSAKLTNPFIEFAIKNPDKASTREVVGLRLSAEKALGLLTLGDENTSKANGINSLSGYMKINPSSGKASTAARTMSYNDTGMTIDGNVKACVFLVLCPTLGFKSNNYSLNLKSAPADIYLNGTTVNGTRMSSVKLDGYANIHQLDFSGDLQAALDISLGLLKLQKVVDGNITGLKANITVDENLGYVHKLNINNPMSLSLQNQQIWWPKADAAANQGWWLAFDDAIDIGDVTPTDQIQVTNDVLKQVVNPISKYIQNNPPTCSLLNCLFGDALTVGNVNLTNTTLNFPLKDLQLSKQSFAPNCYGNLKFC